MTLSSKTLLIICAVIVIVCACAVVTWILLFKPYLVMKPTQNLPDYEIAFRLKDNDTTIGFIHPDGSGFTTRVIAISNGLRNLMGGSYSLSPALAWSSDGKALVGGVKVGVPMQAPILIFEDGTFLMCDQMGSNTFALNAIVALDSGNVFFKDESMKPQRIVRVNMRGCSQSTVYTGLEPNVSIGDPSVTREGLLLTGDVLDPPVNDNNGGLIVIYPDGQNQFVLAADDGVWSPDGQLIAYLNSTQDGKLILGIVDKDGGNDRVLLEFPPRVGLDETGRPSWSPDGKWLLFSSEYVIYKLNIESGEKIELYRGGYNPTWR